MSTEGREPLEKDARARRARKIRAQIEGLKQDPTAQPRVGESPAAFVHRRMAELAQNGPPQEENPGTRRKGRKAAGGRIRKGNTARHTLADR
jgi:hypothetical protein